MKNSLIMLLVIICGACNKKQEAETKAAIVSNENRVRLTDAQIKNAGIVTGKIEEKSISSILKVNGSIDVPPQNMVSISIPLGGFLKSTNLLPGMHISKGEVIAVMEDQQYISIQQEYLTSKAKLVYAEAEVKRQEELNKSKATSDKVYQQAQAEFITQKILVKSLSEKLKLISINPLTLTENSLSRSISLKSPIEGYVSKVNANIGKYANPSDILFELVNPSDIHLALNIFEKDISKLFIGQNLVAYTNSNPEKKYPCKLILIGRDLTQDRSIEVHCHFKKYDKSLVPGMFMNAEIEVQNNQVYALPSEAIVNFENQQYIFIAKGSSEFEMHEIKTGSTENGFTEIIFENAKSLSAERVIIKGAYSLLMKMKNTSDD